MTLAAALAVSIAAGTWAGFRLADAAAHQSASLAAVVLSIDIDNAIDEAEAADL